MTALLPMLLITLVAFGTAVAFMAVGVIFGRKCLRGSCGGTPVFGPDGEPLTCATCPNKDKHRAETCAGDDACPREDVHAH